MVDRHKTLFGFGDVTEVEDRICTDAANTWLARFNENIRDRFRGVSLKFSNASGW